MGQGVVKVRQGQVDTHVQGCLVAVAGRFLRIDLGVHRAKKPGDLWLGSNGLVSVSSEMKDVPADMGQMLSRVRLGSSL